MALSHFAGIYSAGEFAYGVNKTTPSLQVINGPSATGAGALTLAFASFALPDGTVVSPLNTNAPITVGGNSSIETVTPSAVSASTPLIYGTPTLNASFTYLHGNGDSIRSGTAGLQEALNYVGAQGGGTVVVDAGWTKLGGTSAMIAAAVIPAGVSLWDNRSGGLPGNVTISLTPAQIDAMFTTPVLLLPAPGANTFYKVNNAVFSTSTGTAYTGGGVIKVGYGSANPPTADALSGDPAATLLTGTQPGLATENGAAIASNTSANYLNEGLYISNATAVFAAGTSTLFVTLDFSIITV